MIISRITLAAVLVASSLSAVMGKDLCRCEAEFEQLYGRRRLMEGPKRVLAGKSYPYDYDNSYVNDEGYYVVDGVVVLPDDSPYCSHTTHNDYQKSLYKMMGGHRDLLEEEDEEEEVEDAPRELRGGGSKSSKGDYYYGGGGGSKSSKGDYGDYYYGGKGKVRSSTRCWAIVLFRFVLFDQRCPVSLTMASILILQGKGKV